MDEGCPLRPLETLKLIQETHGNKFTNSPEGELIYEININVL